MLARSFSYCSYVHMFVFILYACSFSIDVGPDIYTAIINIIKIDLLLYRRHRENFHIIKVCVE